MGEGGGADGWTSWVVFPVSGFGAGASHIEHVEELVEFESVQFTHCQVSPAGGLSGNVKYVIKLKTKSSISEEPVSVCTVAGAVVEAVGSGTVMAAAVAMARTRNTVVPSMTPQADNKSLSASGFP